MTEVCEICGSTRGLDRHHVVPRRMGGTREPAVHNEANLMTLCRSCHRNLHEGRWLLCRSPEGIRVVDSNTGEQVMRRLHDPDLDVPSLFQLLNLAEDSLSQLLQALPYLSDEQLVEGFSYARTFGKRSWLMQAAILYEAQQRSTYGDRSLEAIARRFDISLRQAQKYALVWRVFFTRTTEEENVNVDAILLEEPSWYVVAATESQEPEEWLAHAQDRKAEDPRYSVAHFRRDIQLARQASGVQDIVAPGVEEAQWVGVDLPRLEGRACPWLKLFCQRSGTATSFDACSQCELVKDTFCETKPTNEGEESCQAMNRS